MKYSVTIATYSVMMMDKSVIQSRHPHLYPTKPTSWLPIVMWCRVGRGRLWEMGWIICPSLLKRGT